MAKVEEADKGKIADKQQEEEDVEEQAEKGLKHLFTMNHLDKNAQNVKNRLVSQYAKAAEEAQKRRRWFMAMIHLRKSLKTHEGGSGPWQATRACREKVIEMIEQPKVEVGVLFLILTDMVMVILEAVLDAVFEFGHGGHGDSHGGGHGDGHGGGHGELHEGGHETEHGGGHGHESGHGHEAGAHGSSEHAASDAHANEHTSGEHRRLREVIRTVARPVIRSLVQDGNRLLSSAGGASCDIDKAYEIANNCRSLSIAILFLFLFELFVKCFCAPKAFLAHFGHILDIVVVGGSIVLEFTLHHSVGGLLIFFRCWRGVRIMHGLYEQVEYICNALETEQHLEKTLKIVKKYKTYTELRHLRDDWYVYKKQGPEGLQHSRTRVSITTSHKAGAAIHAVAALQTHHAHETDQGHHVESKDGGTTHHTGHETDQGHHVESKDGSSPKNDTQEVASPGEDEQKMQAKTT